MGYYWLLKIAPFCSGFHLYPIITIAATTAAAVAVDDASVAVGGSDSDDAVNVRLSKNSVHVADNETHAQMEKPE